ncbi:transposase, partial [Aeromonas caviae]
MNSNPRMQIADFFKDYGTEAQCENALLAWRFPNGFICPECANKTCCR